MTPFFVPLKVPCAYQGGKQRVAAQIVDTLLIAAKGKECHFYDLCCGSGSISIELVNRGVEPERIFMLDISSWGAFWQAIGSGTFDFLIFRKYIKDVPENKRDIKNWMRDLASRDITANEAELYPLLQACSFGGKQIYLAENKWRNTCFRDYWEPTAASVRRSPANPMQPSPEELFHRIERLVQAMKGVRCERRDIFSICEQELPPDSVVYVDPPYKNTTGYCFGFDMDVFAACFKRNNPHLSLFVSESFPLGADAKRLLWRGANGGISGNRKEKHQEWLTRL